MTERRGFERRPLALPVEIRRTADAAMTGSLVDLSIGGLSMLAPVPLPIAEVVIVRFDLPDGQGEVAVAVEVLTSDVRLPNALIRGKFDRPSAETVARIAKWSRGEG
jgi:hypothetical protein